MSDPCGFCNGEPVGNAARWTSLDASHYAACPRCGETNLPDPATRDCAAVLRCKNTATHFREHPILGPVACCDDCAVEA